jgi:nitrite reductase/ring-hydroxylating ferredoxin subunit
MSFSGPPGRGRLQQPARLVEDLEGAEALDGYGKKLGKIVRDNVPQGPVKDAISGSWIGHALHPLLTDVVIGSFTSASLLDLFGSRDDGRASEKLIAIGIAAYGPTALSGVNDWADTEPASDAVRRIGLVHAATNAAALSLYAASLAARRRGSRGAGTLLGLAGAATLAGGGYLGGHLSFSRGVGVNETAFDPGPEDWTPAVEASQLSDGAPKQVVVDETPVLLLRKGDRIFAIHDRCSHRGCSLSEGELEGDEVVCACHGSRFDLADGSLRAGPASSPQPAFEAREREGKIEIRLGAGA